jgi:hypothetical protein
MSYGLKYSSIVTSKNEDIYQLKVYERDYSGVVTDWELGSPALQKAYLASSDDVLEPFLASSLTVNVLQGETYNLPDVTTYDDRKYLVELLEDSTIIFKGFLINDSISLPFTTGKQYINLSFTDGIGILKNIELIMPLNDSPPSLNTGNLVSLLDVVLICIRALEYDININIATSIFAAGMDDRGDGTEYEPLSQSYLPIRDFLRTDETFISCYDALEMILRAFGAQLIQDNGEFWFVSQYERDNANLYFTKYDLDGNVLSSGLRSNSISVGSYPSEPYFINNVQTKILKKGFNKVILENPNEYAVEMLANPNLIIGTLLLADYWTIDTPTYTSFVHTILPYFDSDMTGSLIPIGSLTGVTSDTNFKINVDDSLTFTYTVYETTGPDVNNPSTLAYIRITDGTDSYYWTTDANNNGYWLKNAGGNDRYFKTSQNSTTVNVATNGSPIDGTVYLGVFLIKGVTNQGAQYGEFGCSVQSAYGSYSSISTLGSVGTLSGSTITLAFPYTFNIGRKLKLVERDSPIENSIYADLLSQSGLTLTLTTAPRTGYTTYIVSQDFQFEKSSEIKIGTTGLSKSLKGVLVDSSSNPLVGWYRYGIAGTYTSLFDLLNIVYANQYAYNQINMEGSIYSINDSISSFIFVDSTNGYNVTNKRYVIGNMNIDYISNEMNGTFLEVNKEDISVARYNIYNKK